MSGKCDNCDCSDSSQCVASEALVLGQIDVGSEIVLSKIFMKKGNSLVIVETEKSYDTVVMDAPAAENDGKCKCGTTCSCTDCKCGH